MVKTATPPTVKTTTTAAATTPNKKIIVKDGNFKIPEPGECGVSTQFNVRVVGGTNASLGELNPVIIIIIK